MAWKVSSPIAANDGVFLVPVRHFAEGGGVLAYMQSHKMMGYRPDKPARLPHDDLRAWCQTNCSGEWKMFPKHTNNVEFELEDDAVLFYMAYA